jgi:DNA-binding NarL/FixJ family response regulator
LRVFIADDHAAFRNALAQLLQSHPGLKVCGEAVDGLDAIHEIDRLQPDLIILDINMPRMDGFTAAKEIRKLLATPILFISVQADAEMSLAAKECGGQGLIAKRSLATSLLPALDALRAGKTFFNGHDPLS